MVGPFTYRYMEFERNGETVLRKMKNEGWNDFINPSMLMVQACTYLKSLCATVSAASQELNSSNGISNECRPHSLMKF